MAERAVIDASVGVALVAPESGTSVARSLVRAYAASAVEILAPTHFWLEVTNALVRGKGTPAGGAIEDLLTLDGLVVRTIEIDRPLLLLTIETMDRFGMTAYDAAYIALARSMDARLATLDQRLASAATQAGVPTDPEPPRRIADAGARDVPDARLDPAWAHSAAIGQQIAELRRSMG